MRIIAGDIGGTKTLLRCVEASGEISAEQRFESGEFSSFDELLRAFTGRCAGTIDAACFAVAGPVFDERAEVTNLGWKMAARELSSAFSIARVTLINDFYAIALGVPLLGEDDLLSLHKGRRAAKAPMAILGAGTGLGQANVVFDNDGDWTVIPSEGGHADFAPQDERQTQLLLRVIERHGHASWERVCSGMGLTNIYEFLTGRGEEPARIAELAEVGESAALETFAMFVDIYGSEAGNMALRVLARGGVFLAGGIAAKNVRFFADGRFIEAFLRKGRFRDVLEDVPVDLVVNEQVGLIGAVEGARRLVRN
ncbi:MAG TPA: glucokinase [Thermoanaerobaculia bacterium]